MVRNRPAWRRWHVALRRALSSWWWRLRRTAIISRRWSSIATRAWPLRRPSIATLTRGWRMSSVAARRRSRWRTITLRRTSGITRLRHSRWCRPRRPIHARSRRRITRPRTRWSVPRLSLWWVHAHSGLGCSGWTRTATGWHSYTLLRHSRRSRASRWAATWCTRRSSRASRSSGRIGVVDKLHKLGIAVRATLERGAIFNHEPEESSLHVCVAFPNDVDLWGNKVGTV
jgi:hypothetical protein